MAQLVSRHGNRHWIRRPSKLFYNVFIVSRINIKIYSRPQTKLREGNVFTSGGGLSVQDGSLCPRSLCPGGSLSGGLCQGDPLYGKERTVRILLECFLVMNPTCAPWVKFRKYFEMRQGQKIHFKVLTLESMRIFFSVEFLVLGA